MSPASKTAKLSGFKHHRGATAMADRRSLRRAALLLIKCRTTPLSQGPSPSAGAFKAYLGGDSEVAVQSELFWAEPHMIGMGRPSGGKCRASV